MKFTSHYTWVVLPLLMCIFGGITARSTPGEATEDEEEIDFKVIVKREAGSEIQQDYPPVEGRTFRASEPLNPSSPLEQIHRSPVSHEPFETVNTIFQPNVDETTGDTAPEEVSELTEDEEKETPDSTTNINEEESQQPGFSAQYPYAETTSTNQQYTGYGAGSAQDTGYTPGDLDQPGYQSGVVEASRDTGGYVPSSEYNPDSGSPYHQSVVSRRVVTGSSGGESVPSGESGYDSYTNRRVVVAGSRGGGYGSQTGTGQQDQRRYVVTGSGRRQTGTGENGQGGYGTETVTGQSGQRGYGTRPDSEAQMSRVRTNGNFPSSQQSQHTTSYTNEGRAPTDNTYNRQYPSGSQRVTNERRTYTGTGYGNQNTGYGTSGSVVRGAYYDGERFVDNNGHYIDANGRHLDSSGRYYDISGRHQDAVVTRTVTYGTSQDTGPRYTDATGAGYTGVSGGSGSSEGVQYVNNVDNSDGGRAVDSYGGTQFYSGGSSYPTTFDPVVSQISSDPVCPRTNNRVTINGLTCSTAISQLGSFVCYNYERVSIECCERCLQVKRPEQIGCEYGDRSFQCRNIQPFDCYNERNRQICCNRCNELAAQHSQTVSAPGCGYGDLTPRCQSSIVQRPHLCYLPENQRLCCNTCPRLANLEEPDCKWGNQSPELCQPFDTNGRLKLNCYLQPVQEVCCATCTSLRDRMPENIPGCAYGDSPVQFSTGRAVLDCGQYIREYGIDNCDDHEVATKCCYTCYRYRNRRG